MQIKPSDRRKLLLILLLAFALRITYVWIHERHVSEEMLARTAAYSYEQGWIARSLLWGKGFSSPKGGGTGPTAMYTPVYPYILLVLFKVFGLFSRGSLLAALALNCAWSALATVPIFLVARRWRPGGGFGAAWLWAVYPSAIAMADLNWTQALSALLAAWILWAALAVQDSERRRDWVLYGLLWGLACLVNPAIFAALPFVLAWHCWRGRRQAAKYLRLCVFAGFSFLLACLPWTARNYRVFHEFVPFRSSFGYELWLGNNSRVPNSWMGAASELDPLYSPAEFAKFQSEGELSYIREKKVEAMVFIEGHAGTEVRYTALRILNFWEGTWFLRGDGEWASTHWRFRAILVCESLLPLLALAGIGRAMRERIQTALPAAAFLVFFPVVYYVTHAHTGYRNPLDPVLVLFASLLFCGTQVRDETAGRRR